MIVGYHNFSAPCDSINNFGGVQSFKFALLEIHKSHFFHCCQTIIQRRKNVFQCTDGLPPGTFCSIGIGELRPTKPGSEKLVVVKFAPRSGPMERLRWFARSAYLVVLAIFEKRDVAVRHELIIRQRGLRRRHNFGFAQSKILRERICDTHQNRKQK